MADLTKENYDSLIESISQIILSKGLKATTMDSVAASLSMSKRTLYEIFDSKMDMIIKVVNFWQEQHCRDVKRIFDSSDNVLEAMFRVFTVHSRKINSVSLEFFRDMDYYFPEVREIFEKNNRFRSESLMEVIRIGINQGVFREDVNYPVTFHLMRIQMESLKRMEKHFPPEISRMEALDTINIGFLRSIASPEGNAILDKIYADYKKKNSESNLNSLSS